MRLSLAVAALLPVALAQGDILSSAASGAAGAASSAVSAIAGAASSVSDSVASGTSSAGATETGTTNGTTDGGNSTAAGNATEYGATVIAALTAANLTSLAGLLQNISTTPEGQSFISKLQSGNNKTVFAPTNEAIATINQEVQADSQLMSLILGYHVLNNTYTMDGIETPPKHTIARTLMQGGNYTLPGSRSHPLVFAKGNSTGFDIISSTSNISVTGNATTAGNLEVYIVDRVIPIPPRIEEIAPAVLPELAKVLNSSNLIEPLKNAPGITVFAPNDAAFLAAANVTSSLTQENITAIVANHVINGTVLYSSQLEGANDTSAGGSPFSFVSNDTGAWVTSGNSTAKIIQSDIIIANGVIHIIDGVLANTNSDPEAAASAAASASEAAATNTDPVQTGPVTNTNGTDATSSAPAGNAVALGFSGLTVGLTVAGLALGFLAV
jgi:uncharacterized surface protein with fasciclin (FAS1) repeats